SSRRRHTSSDRDWSSDVCSSDLRTLVARVARVSDVVGALGPTEFAVVAPATDHAGAVKLARRITAALSETLGSGGVSTPGSTLRSEERRVGKVCRAQTSTCH